MLVSERKESRARGMEGQMSRLVTAAVVFSKQEKGSWSELQLLEELLRAARAYARSVDRVRLS